jgi:hypothetical protein
VFVQAQGAILEKSGVRMMVAGGMMLAAGWAMKALGSEFADYAEDYARMLQQ